MKGKYRHQKLLAGQASGMGGNHLPPRGALRYDGERLQCHICGKWRIFLGQHVVKKHGWTVDDYRDAYGLNATQPLCTPELSDKMFARAQMTLLMGSGFSKDNPPPEAPRKRNSYRLQARLTQKEAHVSQQFSEEAFEKFKKNLEATRDIQPCAFCGGLVIGCKKHTHLCDACRKPWRAKLQRERRKRSKK